MKKVILFIGLFAVTMLGVQGVFAEDLIEPIVTEPNTFDSWVATITDFASLKNFILSVGGLSTIMALIKTRSIFKYFKTPIGIAKIEEIGFNILSKLTDKPEVFVKIMAMVVEFPMIKKIVDNATLKVEMYEVELLDKMVSIEGKLEAKLFLDNPTANQNAVILLQKYRDEYEAIQLNK